MQAIAEKAVLQTFGAVQGRQSDLRHAKHQRLPATLAALFIRTILVRHSTVLASQPSYLDNSRLAQRTLKRRPDSVESFIFRRGFISQRSQQKSTSIIQARLQAASHDRIFIGTLCRGDSSCSLGRYMCEGGSRASAAHPCCHAVDRSTVPIWPRVGVGARHGS